MVLLMNLKSSMISMFNDELIPGQSKREKLFLEDIKEKNKCRERLPRGVFIEKNSK